MIPLLNLASVAYAHDDLDRAREYAERALAAAEKEEDEFGRGLAHSVLGKVSLGSGDPEQSVSHLKRAVLFLSRCRERAHAAESQLLLGKVLISLNRGREAVTELSQARENFVREDDVQGEVRSLSLLAAAYESFDAGGDALAFWELAIERARAPGCPAALRRVCLREGVRLAQERRQEDRYDAWATELLALRAESR